MIIKKIALTLTIFTGLFFIAPALQAAGDSELIPFNNQRFIALNAGPAKAAAGSFATARFYVNTPDPLKTVSAVTTKSVGKAFLFSLLLPGSGQYYLGYKNSAAVFLGLEAFCWLGLWANASYGAYLTTEYQTYAVQHAGVQKQGKNRRYWSDIGKYDDIYAFNQKREQERNFADLYDENTQNYWKWDSHVNRLDYDGKRLHANAVDARDVYFQLAVVVNHLAGAIHALFMARKQNSRKKRASWNWQLKTYGFTPGRRYLGFRLSKIF